jgi:hypothetical protein
MYAGAYTTRESNPCPECGDTYTGWSNARQGYYCPRHEQEKFERFLQSGWFRLMVFITYTTFSLAALFLLIYVAAWVVRA